MGVEGVLSLLISEQLSRDCMCCLCVFRVGISGNLGDEGAPSTHIITQERHVAPRNETKNIDLGCKSSKRRSYE